MTKKKTSGQVNKLKKYKLILDLYNKYKTDDISTTVVWKKYICPVYPISRTTLYEVLNTPVYRDLAKLENLVD